MPAPATLVTAALVSATFITALVMSAATVARLILSRFDKVNRPVAGVVFTAMTGPIPRVSWRHMQIEGVDSNAGLLANDHRLCVDKRGRWCITDPHFPIDARGDFTTYSDVDYRCSRMRRQAAQQEGHQCCCLKGFHEFLSEFEIQLRQPVFR